MPCTYIFPPRTHTYTHIYIYTWPPGLQASAVSMSYFILWHLFISFQMHYISDLSILRLPPVMQNLGFDTPSQNTIHIPTSEFNKQLGHSEGVSCHHHHSVKEVVVQLWSIDVVPKLWMQGFLIPSVHIFYSSASQIKDSYLWGWVLAGCSQVS